MDVAQELHPYRSKIEQALSSGSMTYEELQANIEAGRLFLLSNDGAVLVYERIALADGSWAFCVFVVAGTLGPAQRLLDEAERMANEYGAVQFTAIGRPGWAPEARRRGMTTVLYSKRLR